MPTSATLRLCRWSNQEMGVCSLCSLSRLGLKASQTTNKMSLPLPMFEAPEHPFYKKAEPLRSSFRQPPGHIQAHLGKGHEHRKNDLKELDD